MRRHKEGSMKKIILFLALLLILTARIPGTI